MNDTTVKYQNKMLNCEKTLACIWGVLPTDSLCPIVVIASLFCFVFFFTLDLTLDTYRLARHTESIYFIHIVVQQIIWTL